MKKRILVLLLIVVLLLAGCRKNKNQEATVPMQTTVAETTEESVPGVGKNIFDQNGNVNPEYTQPQTEETTKPTETTPQVTVPQGPSGSDGPGLQEPEAPDDDVVPPSVKPTEKDPEPTQPTGKEPESSDDKTLDYQKFQAMSPSEQQATMESFESIEKFFDWYDAAKKEHEEANPPVDVGDGNIDLDQIINGKN